MWLDRDPPHIQYPDQCCDLALWLSFVSRMAQKGEKLPNQTLVERALCLAIFQIAVITPNVAFSLEPDFHLAPH
jgi:hypothetical protein